MPRQAFNANTYLHQPLKSLDFPDTAYPQNPDLGFSIEPVNGRTLRLRIHTSPVAPADPDSLSPMLAGPVANDASAWKVTQGRRRSLHLALRFSAHPGRSWRIVILDSEGPRTEPHTHLERQRFHPDQGATIQLHQARSRQLPLHQPRLLPYARRTHLRLLAKAPVRLTRPDRSSTSSSPTRRAPKAPTCTSPSPSSSATWATACLSTPRLR